MLTIQVSKVLTSDLIWAGLGLTNLQGFKCDSLMSGCASAADRIG